MKPSNKSAKTYIPSLPIPEYFHVLLAICIGLVYYVISTFSVGFYTHDEVWQFMNMQSFWINWENILGLWSKPGWKIFYAVPALLGWNFVIVVNCAVTAAMAYTSGLVAKQYMIKDRVAVVLLCAFMPMLYQISYRNYSELLFGFFLILSIFLIKRENYIWGAIIASMLFPIRQEGSIYALCLGVLFIRDKRLLPFLALAISPVLWNLVGYMASGNPFYIIDLMTKGVGKYMEAGFFHLWGVYLPICGPAIFLLSIIGLFGFLVNKQGIIQYLKKYELLYLSFLPIFLFYCLMTDPSFTWLSLMSNWKMMAPFAPILALFSGLGLRFIKIRKNKTYTVYTTVLIICLTAISIIYLSYDHNYVFFNKELRDFRIPIAVFLIGLFLLCINFTKIKSRYIGIGVGFFSIIFTILIEKPIPLSSEDKALKEAANWFEESGFKQEEKIYVSHNVFHFFLNSNAKERSSKYITIRSVDQLNNLLRGSKIIWESHYSERTSGVKIDFFQNNPNFELIYQKLTDDNRFYLAIFSKI